MPISLSGGGGGSSTLGSDTDVSTGSAVDGSLLRYNAASKKWVAVTKAQASGIYGIYRAYASASVTYAADPTTYTAIPGLSVTFTLDATYDVEIECYAVAEKSGGESHLQINDGGTVIWGTGDGTNVVTNWRTADGIYLVTDIHLMASLGAGSHTIQPYWNAAANTAQITWYQRMLIAKVYV